MINWIKQLLIMLIIKPKKNVYEKLRQDHLPVQSQTLEKGVKYVQN